MSVNLENKEISLEVANKVPADKDGALTIISILFLFVMHILKTQLIMVFYS